MVEQLQFTLDETAQKIEPAVALEASTLARTNRSPSPTVIEDSVTLSPEALAASPASNLLTFASSNNPALSVETANAVGSSTGSEIQKLLNEGYSLSQITAEFDIALADIASEYGIKIFNTAA